MYKIVGKNIQVTRGDAISIKLVSSDEHQFHAGDIIKMSIVEKGDYSKIVFQKKFTVSEDANYFYILLSSEDTKLGDIINKKKDYWYEIELNNNQTLIGHDDTGAKLFTIFPEAKDQEE